MNVGMIFGDSSKFVFNEGDDTYNVYWNLSFKGETTRKLWKNGWFRCWHLDILIEEGIVRRQL